QNLAKGYGCILAVAGHIIVAVGVGSGRTIEIVPAAAVAEADVQIAVRAKPQAAPLVIALRVIDRQQDARTGIGHIWIRRDGPFANRDLIVRIGSGRWEHLWGAEVGGGPGGAERLGLKCVELSAARRATRRVEIGTERQAQQSAFTARIDVKPRAPDDVPHVE